MTYDISCGGYCNHEYPFVALMRESAHALKCLMKRQTGEMAAQMLASGMIPYLLEVLEGRMDGGY